MNDTTTKLPAGFEALEAFVEQWTAATADERTRIRLERGENERLAFFNALNPRVTEALAYLDAKPLAQLDDSEQRLMSLLLTFPHIAQAVEVQRDTEARHGELRRHFTITRAPADEPAETAA